MTFQASTGLRTKMLDTSPLRTLLNLGFIKVYTGAPPASADAAPTGTLLLTISNNAGGTGLTFNAAAAAGAISKNSGETWSGNAVASGTAGYYRFVQAGDSGALSTTDCRVQGLCGVAASELNLTTTSLINTTLYSVDAYSIGLPTL